MAKEPKELKDRRCLECKRLITSDHRRGLCRNCYDNPEVVERYEPLPRGSWSRVGYTSWSGHDRIRLIELYDAGMPDREIAQLMGRSEGAIAKQRHRMGIMWVHSSRHGLRRIEPPVCKRAGRPRRPRRSRRSVRGET